MTLRLNGIDVDCIIGERPDERTRLQTLRVDVELEVDEEGVGTRDAMLELDFPSRRRSIPPSIRVPRLAAGRTK